MPVRDASADELRAVAPLVTLVDGAPHLIAPVMLIANGPRVIGVTSAELLRPQAGKALAIATRLDGSTTVPVTGWHMGRYTGVALLELGGEVGGGDVEPLAIGSVNASVHVHGAPAAIITTRAAGSVFERVMIPVHVDADDAGGMTDHAIYVASPLEVIERMPIEGAAVFAWLPAEPALGRPPELVAFALAYPYRAQLAKARELPPIAELVGLEDLGKALMVVAPEPDERPELGTVAGEIVRDTDDPLVD